jgi:hypothetical protein
MNMYRVVHGEFNFTQEFAMCKRVPTSLLCFAHKT